MACDKKCIMGCNLDDGRTCHCVPENPVKRAEWFRILGVESKKKSLYICSAHFLNCHVFGSRLSKYAVPISSPNNANNQKNKTISSSEPFIKNESSVQVSTPTDGNQFENEFILGDITLGGEIEQLNTPNYDNTQDQKIKCENDASFVDESFVNNDATTTNFEQATEQLETDAYFDQAAEQCKLEPECKLEELETDSNFDQSSEECKLESESEDDCILVDDLVEEIAEDVIEAESKLISEDFEIRQRSTNDIILKGHYSQFGDNSVVNYKVPIKEKLTQKRDKLRKTSKTQRKQLKLLKSKSLHLYKELQKYKLLAGKLKKSLNKNNRKLFKRS